MSVSQTKTPQTGFLRDFHFSTLADVVLTDVFGDIPQPSWMRFTFEHTLSVLDGQFVFTIAVRIDPHRREVAARRPELPKIATPLVGDAAKRRALVCSKIARAQSPKGSAKELEEVALELMNMSDSNLHRLIDMYLVSPGMSFSVPRPKSFDFRFNIPRSVVEQFRSDVPKLFVKWTKTTLLANAYKLYEFDPRKGWSWDYAEGLPSCPLFDPVGDFSRTGLSIESQEGSIIEPTCAFCGKPHDAASPPLWAGANMMWLHRECWRNPS